MFCFSRVSGTGGKSSQYPQIFPNIHSCRGQSEDLGMQPHAVLGSVYPRTQPIITQQLVYCYK